MAEADAHHDGLQPRRRPSARPSKARSPRHMAISNCWSGTMAPRTAPSASRKASRRGTGGCGSSCRRASWADAGADRRHRCQRSAYFGILDSDDLLHAGALAETVPVMKSDPDIAIVYTDRNIMDAAGKVDRPGALMRHPLFARAPARRSDGVSLPPVPPRDLRRGRRLRSGLRGAPRTTTGDPHERGRRHRACPQGPLRLPRSTTRACRSRGPTNRSCGRAAPSSRRSSAAASPTGCNCASTCRPGFR